MSIPGLDYCFINPNLIDFKADTLRKAIVKLHRLNAACHTSPDDWAQNLLESTKDLRDPVEQEKFYQYLANPSGFEENKELWDALEAWDQEHNDPQIVRECQHDVWDDSMFQNESTVVGNVMYISVVNTENKEALRAIEEEKFWDEHDEKIPEVE